MKTKDITKSDIRDIVFNGEEKLYLQNKKSKGMLEYINGLIRRFLPKGTNFDNITDEQIKRIENRINNRSMKILGWKSPNEIFKSVAL